MSSLTLSAYGCGESGSVASTRAPLRAECATDDLPSGSWFCSEPRTVECVDGGADVEVVFVEGSEALQCGGSELSVSDPGPFPVGTHAITVSDESGVLCETQLTVVDTQAAEVEEHVIALWPPNHKLHDISVDDCVSVNDACDSELHGEFIWGSSDEPVNDLGDGNHEPDIVFGDCEHVSVRAERQGPKDGRVYHLGVRVVDGAGNETEGVCTIIVDHDQRGVEGADSGEAYRITLDGSDGGLACDGVTEPPAEGEAGAGGAAGTTAGGGGIGGAAGDAAAGAGGIGGNEAGAGGVGGSEAGAGGVGGSEAGAGGVGGSEAGAGGAAGSEAGAGGSAGDSGEAGTGGTPLPDGNGPD